MRKTRKHAWHTGCPQWCPGNDMFIRAALSNTSFLPRVGDQVFSVLKLLCLLFQVIQELLSLKGACGRLGGLVLLPQACRQQSILWWRWGAAGEREGERKRESDQLLPTCNYPEPHHWPAGASGPQTKSLLYMQWMGQTKRGRDLTKVTWQTRGQNRLGLRTLNPLVSLLVTFVKARGQGPAWLTQAEHRGLPGEPVEWWVGLNWVWMHKQWNIK
jgi:hypothetical protein